MLVLGHTAWEGGGARSWLRLKALPTAEGGSNGGSSAAGALPRLPEPEELTADEAAPVEYVASFDQLRDVGLGQALPAPGGADEGGAGPVQPEGPLVSQRQNNVELMRVALEAKGGADAEDCRRQEAAARGDEARMEQPAASAGGEAGCIPAGVVLHSGGAASSGGSFITAPTAATVGSAGSGSKRNWVADADSVGSEIARHHRAERRQREAAAPGAVVVPASHRAAVLEGLRRVLGKEGGDPEEWWERNGTGGPFPFEVELAGP